MIIRGCMRSGAILLIALVLISAALIYGLNGGIAKMSGGVGLSGFISVVLGYLGLGKVRNVKAAQRTAVEDKHDTAVAKVETQAVAGANAGDTSLLTRIERTAQQTGKMVLDALERGYEQARIESGQPEP